MGPPWLPCLSKVLLLPVDALRQPAGSTTSSLALVGSSPFRNGHLETQAETARSTMHLRASGCRTLAILYRLLYMTSEVYYNCYFACSVLKTNAFPFVSSSASLETPNAFWIHLSSRVPDQRPEIRDQRPETRDQRPETKVERTSERTRRRGASKMSGEPDAQLVEPQFDQSDLPLDHPATPSSHVSPLTTHFSLSILLFAVFLNLLERVVLAYYVPDIRQKLSLLQHDIASLRAQAMKLVSPDTFAQAAKADRKAIALEKEVERLQRVQAVNKGHWLVRLPGLLRSVLFLGLMFVVVMSPKGSVDVGDTNRRVVLFLEPGWVWPLGRWMSVLSGHGSGSGVVGAVPWAVLSHRVSKYVLGM